MCAGIALAQTEIPVELAHRHGLLRRVHRRGGEPEYQFHFRDRDPVLPVWWDGQLRIVRWGNAGGHSRFLPRTGWTWQETLDDGGWRNTDASLVRIPASLGLERGVWFRVREGMRGIVVTDEHGGPVAYMVCEPSSHYFQVMTRCPRMPVLIDERI
jgi:hypothetical protein